MQHVAVNQDSRANFLRKLDLSGDAAPEPRAPGQPPQKPAAHARAIPDLLAASFPGERFRGEVHQIEHHLAHLSSAFHVSPFEEAVVVSVDGFGDFSSAAWGVGKGKDISIDGRVYFPHSLGIFYQALTQYLGFPHYGDEYKVMGLAPYGKPAFMDAMRKIVRLKPDGAYELDLTYFRHHKEQISYQWADGSPEFGDLFAPALEALLGPRRAPDDPLEDRHRDIARSVQAMYEEAFFHLIGALQKRYGLTDLALAGGCAMNSVANGKVRRMTPFRRVYVQSAAGDAGGAIGAAFALWHKLGGTRSFVMDHAYWGPQFGPGDIHALIAAATIRDRRGRLLGREHRRRGRAVPAHGRGDRRRQGRRLVPGPHGMGSARARQSFDRLRSASRRHEGHSQRQDQAARIPSVPSRPRCAKGRKADSRRLILALRIAFMSARRGSQTIERLPSARGPHSIRP